jgi:hypothetical protein
MLHQRLAVKATCARAGGLRPPRCWGGASRRSAAVRGQRGDRRDGLLCPRVLYVRRSELKEISPEAVDVSSFDEAKRVASVAEEERRIIEAERRRLGLDA